jgi:hypothetical protein
VLESLASAVLPIPTAVGVKGEGAMQLDDDLCWLCDNPLESDRTATSWHGFGAHRDCARQEAAREDATSLDSNHVISTDT